MDVQVALRLIFILEEDMSEAINVLLATLDFNLIYRQKASGRVSKESLPRIKIARKEIRCGSTAIGDILFLENTRSNDIFWSFVKTQLNAAYLLKVKTMMLQSEFALALTLSLIENNRSFSLFDVVFLAKIVLFNYLISYLI